jgi:peptide-methionine (S)-S-oxide reductase
MNKKEAILGAGCFWCVEAVYQGFQGILHVESGYTGGKIPNPTYERVSVGTTGHAEVIRLEYDPAVISYRDILTIFFHAHDPTTLNRQGADVGTQYRSAIFFTNEEDPKVALEVKAEIEKSGLWSDPIVTEISKLDKYYKAEDYHQNYFNQNKGQPYCSFVIAPKLGKIYKEFSSKLKPDLQAKYLK